MIQLSVIIPVYNTPRELLGQCISSIQNNIRKLGETEILCINDGSTELYIEQMLKDAEAADSRFKYIYKPNLGVSDTRNLGIDMAQGEYIIFVDADDYLEPDAFSYMLESIKKQYADLVVFGFCDNDSDNVIEKEVKKWISDSSKLNAVSTLIENKMKSWYEIGVNLASVWAKIYRRETIIRNHVRFNQSIAPNEDGFFNLCFITNIDKFYIDNKLVYHYVYYDNSAIHKFTNRIINVSINMMPLLENFVISHFPYHKHFFDLIIQRAYCFVRANKQIYFTNPHNPKSFWELKSEMDDYLNNPSISKWLKQMKLFDAENMIDFKNRLLLKLHLYWIFLITERRKRRKSFM